MCVWEMLDNETFRDCTNGHLQQSNVKIYDIYLFFMLIAHTF